MNFKNLFDHFCLICHDRIIHLPISFKRAELCSNLKKPYELSGRMVTAVPRNKHLSSFPVTVVSVGGVSKLD